MAAAAVPPAGAAPAPAGAARTRREPRGRRQRGRARRADYGFPPVWLAALKVILMVGTLIALVGGVPAVVLGRLLGA